MKDWLEEAAGLHGKRDFIITGKGSFSFNELNEKVIYLAHFLYRDYKVERGDIAAVLSENNVDFIILLFALWKLGAVPVPINSRLNEYETDRLLNFLKPSHIVTIPSIDNNLIYKDAVIIELAADLGVSAKDEFQEYGPTSKTFQNISFDENNTSLILFTSGTSGNPKGVQLSFHNLKASFENSNTVLHHNGNDKWIASLPFYHIGGFSIFTRAILSGIPIIIPTSLKTEVLAESIFRHRPTFISLVSTQLKRFLEMGIKPYRELRCVLLGGGYIEDSLLDEAIKEGWPISKVYGSTESSSLITYVDCIKNRDKKASGGKPLGNNQILVVNERKEPVQINTMGEVAIISESCAKGYYNNLTETINKFRSGIYYTGDSGYIDDDGYLYIDSRMNDLIISGGENINPMEIEAALKEITGIKNASVFGQEDEEWGHIVSAAIITNKGYNISEAELKNQLLRKISPFKIPKKYYFIDELPMGPLGKVQKDKLREIVKNY